MILSNHYFVARVRTTLCLLDKVSLKSHETFWRNRSRDLDATTTTGITVIGANTLNFLNPASAPSINVEYLRHWVGQAANATSAQQRIELVTQVTAFPTLVGATPANMIYAASKPEIEAKRKAFIRKWRLKCHAVAASLEEAGDKLFAFARFPKSQWKSIRTSNAIERLHEEFKRRIKTQTVLPSAETAAMLFWALLASGQIAMRKVDGWQSLAEKPSDRPIDLAA
jgi:hypothetical protein